MSVSISAVRQWLRLLTDRAPRRSRHVNVVVSAAQASYLALPTADRACIEEFVDAPSTAVKRTYKRRR